MCVRTLQRRLVYYVARGLVFQKISYGMKLYTETHGGVFQTLRNFAPELLGKSFHFRLFLI